MKRCECVNPYKKLYEEENIQIGDIISLDPIANRVKLSFNKINKKDERIIGICEKIENNMIYDDTGTNDVTTEFTSETELSFNPITGRISGTIPSTYDQTVTYTMHCNVWYHNQDTVVSQKFTIKPSNSNSLLNNNTNIQNGEHFKRELGPKDLKKTEAELKELRKFLEVHKNQRFSGLSIRKYEDNPEICRVINLNGVSNDNPDDYDFGMMNKNKAKITN